MSSPGAQHSHPELYVPLSEFGAQGLAQFHENGALVVQDVLPAALCEHFRAHAEQAYQARAWAAERGVETLYTFRFGNLHFSDCVEVSKDAQLYFRYLLQQSLLSVAFSILGERFTIVANSSFPRRQSTDIDRSIPVPFHTDFSFMGFEHINLWIPYDDGVNQVRSGLELVLQSNREEIQPTRGEGDGLYRDIELDPQGVTNKFRAEQFWHPQLNRGDILVIDGRIVHRTHFPPDAQFDRYSGETRCFSDIPGHRYFCPRERINTDRQLVSVTRE